MDIYLSFTAKSLKPKLFKKSIYGNVYPWIKNCCDGLRALQDDVYLITDVNGAEFLKDINFKRAFIVLDGIDEKYAKEVPSLSKLYAIKHAASKNKPFVHIDYDFTLSKPIPERLKESKIFVQSIEYDINSFGYNTEKYNKICKNKLNIETDIAYNCGMIGGTDTNLLHRFAEEAINLVEDPKNKNFWLKKHRGFKSWTKAVLAEQYFLSCFLKKENIEPELFFDNSFALKEKDSKYNYSPKDPKWYFETGGIHFYGFWKELELYRYKTGLWPTKFQIILLKLFQNV